MDSNDCYIEPNTYDVTWLGDRYATTISTGGFTTSTSFIGTTRDIDGGIRRVVVPSTAWTSTAYSNPYVNSQIYGGEEELPDMFTTENEKDHDYMVVCKGQEDLSAEKILKSLSFMKGKLEIDCAAFRIKKIECYMTPIVKHNIIKAGKRLAMYGKKRPFVARFDEYGHQLPDEISIDTTNGITLKIIDPEEYEEFYLALKAVSD